MTMVLAILRARPEHVDELDAALRDVAGRTAGEPGALAYSVARQDGGRFLVVERYADGPARDAHFAAPYVAGLLDRFPLLLAEEPVVEFAEVVTGFTR
ncbi:Quinol monooxygenase YgiN [Streptomyces sp. TLI_053]|uniref:putative quinol monooxygenase n=1 Tax=Streptomyces sp. TLI_053 TaxID=1855352 RepID=UPI00087B0DF6|nr:antibiotic biosynthesis monooxygenase [Streptomyces sp. TLI_053]SDT82902.1 Quinol monooxygenase YgiN [Streptomyces sp. TLI_053]